MTELIPVVRVLLLEQKHYTTTCTSNIIGPKTLFERYTSYIRGIHLRLVCIFYNTAVYLPVVDVERYCSSTSRQHDVVRDGDVKVTTSGGWLFFCGDVE